MCASESSLLTHQRTLLRGRAARSGVPEAAGDLARWRRAPPASAAASPSIMQGSAAEPASFFTGARAGAGRLVH